LIGMHPPPPAADPAAVPPPREMVTIRCREHGPLVVDLPGAGEAGGPRVGLRVVDHAGREFLLPTHKPAVALCRCGQSDNKPFCDGSHGRAGFRAAETAPPDPCGPVPG
jgi:CDGSH-type Zn-finger protein